MCNAVSIRASYVLNVHVCAVVPQPWMMRHIASSCVNTRQVVEARAVFLSTVVPPDSALSSLRYADFWALSSTGRVPLPVLVKYVAICVCVGRQCHQSGGTGVVDLPDILLPEDQHLDLFDSESDVSGDDSDDELVEVL